MKFNLKNYPQFKPLEYEKESLDNFGKPLNKNYKIEKLQLPQIINQLNNSNLLNIPNQDEVNIIFENFSWFGEIRTILKNFISRTINEENFESSVAHYDNQTKNIHIFNGILEPKLNNENVKESYQTLTSSSSNPNFLVNFFVLHEIGHAIHDQIRNEQSFNNLTDYFKEYSNNKLHNEQTLIVRENFADMFATIALTQIDKNNKDLINDLETFSQFRKDIKEEKYYTFNSLDKIISDVKNNNLNFSKIDDVLNYININTDNEIKIRLNESLSKILNSQEHNKQLGYLSELFKIEDKSINGIVSFLKIKIDYQKPDYFIYEDDSFKEGQSAFHKTTLVQRIIKLRSNLISEHLPHNLKNQ
jgi:hypothetical protein